MRELVAAESMDGLGEWHFLYLDVWADWCDTNVPVQNHGDEIYKPAQLALLLKYMRMKVLAVMHACAVHLPDPSITAEEEACNVAEVAIAKQAGSVNGMTHKTRMMICTTKELARRHQIPD